MYLDKRVGWRHWYHITLGTYGHWLPGDERGWCERHHRKHVPLYRPPERAKFQAGLHEHAKKLLKQAPVTFESSQFSTIGKHFIESLKMQKTTCLSMSVGAEHCHLLVQCPTDDPRRCSGNLKGHVYHRMYKGMHSPWEKRSHEEPIADRAHAVRVFHYILQHASEGAWVWSFRESVSNDSA